MCCRRLSGSRRPGYCQANRPVPPLTRRPPGRRGWHSCRKRRLGVSAVEQLTPGTRVPAISWAGPGCRDMHARCSLSSTQGPQSLSPSGFPVQVPMLLENESPWPWATGGLGREGPAGAPELRERPRPPRDHHGARTPTRREAGRMSSPKPGQREDDDVTSSQARSKEETVGGPLSPRELWLLLHTLPSLSSLHLVPEIPSLAS